jgi:hypothetical protein
MSTGTALEEAAYLQPVLLWEFVKNLTAGGVVRVACLLVILVLLVRWRRAIRKWNAFENSAALRVIVIAAAAMVAWPGALYAQNHYFAQIHAWDRGLLIALFALLCWRPVFVIPFLFQFYIISWQFEYPFGQHSWAATDLPVNLLILFSGAVLASSFKTLRWSQPVLFCFLILVGAHYWPSGFGKLRLGWLFHDHVELLLPATYANGWLAFLSINQIEAITRFIGDLRVPMKAFTLVVECGALFFLIHRKVALSLLPVWVAFHLGVFLLSGICFWQWSVVNLCIAAVVWKSPVFRNSFFTFPRFLASAGLIFLSPLWLKPQNLSWFDSPANYVYRFEATGESGQRYLLHPGYFAPYQYTFTESGFAGATKHPMLSIYWGATSKEIAHALITDGTPEGFFALEKKQGKVRFRQETLTLLESYVRDFIHSRNQRLRSGSPPARLYAPLVLWTLRGENGYNGQEPIRKVEITQVVSYFDGENYQEIRSIPLTSIEIP